MALEQKLLDDLKAQHGSAYPIEIAETKYDPAVTVVVKRPARGEYKRFRAMLFKEDEKPEAMESLAKACLIYPDAATFSELLKDRPALADKIGGVCSELAGGGGEAEAKKH